MSVSAILTFFCASLFKVGLDIDVRIWALGKSSILAALMIVGFSAWHFLDFVKRDRPYSRILAFLSSVYPVWILAVLFGLLMSLESTGRFMAIIPCGGTFQILMQECVGATPPLQLPLDIAALTFMGLLILKLFVTVRSHFWHHP